MCWCFLTYLQLIMPYEAKFITNLTWLGAKVGRPEPQYVAVRLLSAWVTFTCVDICRFCSVNALFNALFCRAMLCINAAYMPLCGVRLFVCPSVCLSRSCILSNRINIHRVTTPNVVAILRRRRPNWGKLAIFDQYLALALITAGPSRVVTFGV